MPNRRGNCQRLTFKPALVLALVVRRERVKGLPRARRGVVLERVVVVVVRLPNMAEGGLRLYLCIKVGEKEL